MKWNARTEKKRFNTKGSVNDVSISKSQDTVIGGDSRGNIYILSLEGKQLWNYNVKDSIEEVSFVRGGYLVASSLSKILCFQLFEESIQNTNFNPHASGQHISDFDFEEEFSFPLEFGNFRVGDIDGDGKNEIVLIDRDRLVALDDKGEKIWEKKIPRLQGANAWIDCLADVDGDFTPEIILHYPRGVLRLEIYNGTVQKGLSSF